MLFDSSIRRELWRSFSGTLIVLLTVLLTMVLIRILSQATKGNLAPTDVGLVLSYLSRLMHHFIACQRPIIIVSTHVRWSIERLCYIARVFVPSKRCT